MCGILRKFDGIGEDAQLPRHKYQVGTSDIEAWQKLTPERAKKANRKAWHAASVDASRTFR